MKKPSAEFCCVMVILVLLAALTGCAGLTKKPPEKRYFVIDVSRETAPSPSKEGAGLRIRKLQVSPLYEGKGFVYRRGMVGYESDYYNEFFIAPGAMLTDEVRQWLERSGLFKNVTDGLSHLESTYVLEGTVTALYGELTEGTDAKAVMEIRFVLINDTPIGSDILLQNRYRREAPLEGRSPEALVRGWNKALEGILIDFEKDLRGAIRPG